MSAENSVSRGSRTAEPQVGEVEFGIPPEIANRYEVRGVEAPDGEQHLGLFRPRQRDVPVIEIADSGGANRIVARREDAETVTALVQIAQHNGWDRVDVDGSPEFRKAVWTAATRAGLEVSGYEPSFAEREQAEAARRSAVSRDTGPPEAVAEHRSASVPGSSAPSIGPSLPPSGRPDVITAAPAREKSDLSDGDSRLLLRISALSEDRNRLVETLEVDMPRLAREVQVERVGENHDALVTALDRALESPSLANSFARAGYTAEDLRGMATANEWDGRIADAIYLVRTDLHRDTISQGRPDRRSRPEITSEPRERVEDQASSDRAPGASAGRRLPAEVPAQPAGERPAAGEELAELFLRGSPERVAADTRLAGAVQAQSVMEQHIGEVFEGDVTRMASANLESRHMISDALRRGFDVAVREPTPVRQIEPMQTRPDLER